MSRAPWLLVTGAPGSFFWPKTPYGTRLPRVGCPPLVAQGRQQPAAGIAIVTAEARPARGGGPPDPRTHHRQAWMLHDWLTVDLNEMLDLPAADLNIINSETE